MRRDPQRFVARTAGFARNRAGSQGRTRRAGGNVGTSGG